MNENQNGNQNGNHNQSNNDNFGKQIGDSVRDALHNGDLNQLKNIGPAVQGAVQKGLGAAGQAMQQAAGQMSSNGQQASKGNPYAPPGQGTRQQNTQQQSDRPAWMGGAAHTGAQGQGAQGYQTSPRPSRKKQRHYYGMLSLVLGLIGVCLFGAFTFVIGLLALATSLFTPLAIGLLFPLAASAVFLGVGASRRGLAGRAQRYYNALGEKNVRTMEEIAQATGKPVERVRKDAKQMIAQELYPDLWIDTGATCLIRGEEAWQLYLGSEQSRKEREAERKRRLDDPETAGIEAFRLEGAETLRKIRAANAAIKGEAIGEKLKKLEGTTGRIFAYVDKHPDKLPDTRKFMSYYLPTTLKLVEKYRQFDEMDVQMDNVVKTKGEIERSLDTIDVAFNNLLESLYHEDTMDVSTDIEVLQTMLEQEGLMGRKFDIDGDGLH